MKHWWFVLLAGCSANLAAAASPYAELKFVEAPSISPDGRHIAAVLNTAQGPVAAVCAFGTTDCTPIAKLERQRDDIHSVTWVSDERVLIAFGVEQRSGAFERTVTGLMSVDVDGKTPKKISRRPTRTTSTWKRSRSETRILSVLNEEPDVFLLQTWDERDNGPAVFRVNAATNEFDKLFANTYDVNQWYADAAGKVRFGMDFLKHYEIRFWHRADTDDDWQRLTEYSLLKDGTFFPVAAEDDKLIVMSDHSLDRLALWRFDVRKAEFEEELFSVDGYDIDGIVVDPERGKIIGVEYLADYPVTAYLDAGWAERQRGIENAFPGMQVRIVSSSRSGKRFLAEVSSASVPPRYYWFDEATNRGGVWLSAYNGISRNPIARTERIEFAARDGMELNAYLTLPLDVESPPLVVFPHGGPVSRDSMYYDPWVQYFADLGYAVLQVNFRGSSGFGGAYRVAGFREWGRAMQTDVYDAVAAVAERGDVATERSCFVGASYGGYVALTAAFQKPDEFRCFVAVAGIADLYRLVMNRGGYQGLLDRAVRKMIGPTDDAESRDTLRRFSAHYNLDDIEGPILLVHGDEDTRVSVDQSRDFYRAAKSAGIDVEYLEVKDAGHSFRDADDRQSMFEAIGRFLSARL